MAELHRINFTTIGDTELFSAIEDFVGSRLPEGDRQSEGFTVDFKQEWGDKSLRVVAGFANTFGGTIVIGVSEDSGRADEIIGVSSARELKTQIAGSIAANITPTPDYEIAECALPHDPSKRLAVLRVRPDPRIHYLLLKGGHPVYVRNQDQAIPASAAELRALIERERTLERESKASQDPFEMLPADFKITRAAIAGTPQQMRNERAEAQSFMRVVIEPQRAVQLDLDYSYEEQFKGCVATRFPSNAEAVSNDMAVEIDFRNRNAYLYKNLRNSPDIETVWAVMSCGATAFACTIGIPVGRLSWSLPDIAANIASTVRVANDVLMAGGYFGEVRMSVEVVPGGATLLMEGNSFAPILRKDFYPRPWPIVVPQYREKPVHLKGTANVTLNFNARFGQLGNFVSNVLNQLLRDMGFSPDLASIRSAVGNL